VGSLATAAMLAFLLAGRGDEFAATLSGLAAWVLAVTVLLQIVALLARSEARHLTIRVAGGTVDRRVLYRTAELHEEHERGVPNAFARFDRLIQLSGTPTDARHDSAP
jgi:hypothetical protein